MFNIDIMRSACHWAVISIALPGIILNSLIFWLGIMSWLMTIATPAALRLGLCDLYIFDLLYCTSMLSLCVSIKWASCITSIASFLCFISWFTFSHLLVGVNRLAFVWPLILSVMIAFVVLVRCFLALGFLMVEVVWVFCLWGQLLGEFGLSAQFGLWRVFVPCPWWVGFPGFGVPLPYSPSPSLGFRSVVGPQLPLEGGRLEPELLLM